MKIPLGRGSGLDSGWPLRDVGANVQAYQAGARFKAHTEGVPMASLDSRYTQVRFNLISVQVCHLVVNVMQIPFFCLTERVRP